MKISLISPRVALFILAASIITAFTADARAQSTFAPRSWTFTEFPTNPPVAVAVSWYRTESLVQNHNLRDGSSPIDLSAGNLVVVYDITAVTNSATTFLSVTGLIVNATGGAFRVEVGPWESNLEPGNYDGWTRILQVVTGTVVNIAVVQRQAIQVLDCTDSRYSTYQAPLTYQINAGDVSNLIERVTEISETTVAVELSDVLDDYLTTTQCTNLFLMR